MPALPIPLAAALILAFLFVRGMLSRQTHWALLTLIAACAAQSAVIALAQHYGVGAARMLQPVTGTLIPPIAWLAFTAVARRPLSPARDLPHAIGPLFTLFCRFAARDAIDIVVPALYAGYGAALLLVLWRGEDSLPQSRLDAGGTPLRVWRFVAAALIASALCDALIALALALGALIWLPYMVSAVSALSVLALGLLSLSESIRGEDDGPEAPPRMAEDDAQALMARLDRLMRERRPYLDTGLTLARLARMIQAPAKQVSAAINMAAAENVSRYVNRHRIEHACGLLRGGATVTTAMFDSGFNTKSNFNREFLRVKGAPPVEWLAAQGRGLTVE